MCLLTTVIILSLKFYLCLAQSPGPLELALYEQLGCSSANLLEETANPTLNGFCITSLNVESFLLSRPPHTYVIETFVAENCGGPILSQFTAGQAECFNLLPGATPATS